MYVVGASTVVSEHGFRVHSQDPLFYQHNWEAQNYSPDPHGLPAAQRPTDVVSAHLARKRWGEEQIQHLHLDVDITITAGELIPLPKINVGIDDGSSTQQDLMEETARVRKLLHEGMPAPTVVEIPAERTDANLGHMATRTEAARLPSHRDHINNNVETEDSDDEWGNLEERHRLHQKYEHLRRHAHAHAN